MHMKVTGVDVNSYLFSERNDKLARNDFDCIQADYSQTLTDRKDLLLWCHRPV